VDLETNSFYAYKPKTCLIQISCTHGDFILDPIALGDLSMLRPVFADPVVEKILHAAENDLLRLKQDYDLAVVNIFDTAAACRILGRKRLGLARILLEEFGVRLDKKFQRCNWENRPISAEQLYYAQLDTHFLIQLRNRLYRELQENNLWSSAREQFDRLEKIRPRSEKTWNPNGYKHLRGAEQLSGTSLRTLKALFSYRERQARKTNKAPFRIMTNEFMVRLAREMPTDRPALLRIRGLPSYFKGKRAEKLLRIVRATKKGKS
jgi:ribonuclease D